MAFVRTREIEASRANAKLDNAIAKLNDLLNSQNRTVSKLSNNVDVLSTSISPKLNDSKMEISVLIDQLSSLKGAISKKAKELDDEAERRWELQQKQKKKEENKDNAVSKMLE